MPYQLDSALYHGEEQGRNKVMAVSYKGLTLVNQPRFIEHRAPYC